ncbi:MAG TPA: hypothetical protein VD735_06335, partial [Candidatus Saccharimonadales bacterium]|nr:hypothetical protein [Candidatus Saccharimonadales bacterium]
MVRIARPSLPAKRILLAVLALALAIVNIPIQPASAALPMTGDGYLYYATQASATTPYKNYTALTNTWSAQANMATVANATHFVRTFNSPTRNERLTMISNTNGQYEMYRWNGSAWVLDWTDTGGGGSATTYTPRFDLAYTSTGDAVAFYGSGSGAANQQVSYRRFTASTSTWGAETNFTINPNNAPGETRFLRVENRPGTDEFAVVWADYQQNLSGNYYDFSANAFSGEPATVLQNNLSII